MPTTCTTYHSEPTMTNFPSRNGSEASELHRLADHFYSVIAPDSTHNASPASNSFSGYYVSYDHTAEMAPGSQTEVFQGNGGPNLDSDVAELDRLNVHAPDGYGATGQDIPGPSDVDVPMGCGPGSYSLPNTQAVELPQLQFYGGPQEILECSEDLFIQSPSSGHVGGHWHSDDPNSTQTSGYTTPGHQSANDIELVVCDFTGRCKHSFLPSASELQRHIDKYHPNLECVGNKIKCPRDGRMITATNFIRHVLNMHFGVFKVQCQICNKSISRADNLERHNSKYHSGSHRGKP